MKRTEAQSVGQIINEVLSRDGLAATFNEQKACYLWPEVVGPEVNRRTLRRYVDHGVMHVYLTSAPLKSELEFMKSRLVELINERVGAPVIERIAIH